MRTEEREARLLVPGWKAASPLFQTYLDRSGRLALAGVASAPEVASSELDEEARPKRCVDFRFLPVPRQSLSNEKLRLTWVHDGR